MASRRGQVYGIAGDRTRARMPPRVLVAQVLLAAALMLVVSFAVFLVGMGGGWLDVAHGYASYALRSSPFVQQGPKVEGRFGDSGALSENGDTAVAGGAVKVGSGEYDYTGAAFVFERSGETWTEQGAPLIPSGQEGQGNLGSVALAADGNTLLVGDGLADHEAGAAWVFTRSGESWTQQGEKLTSASGEGRFGQRVALSADGNTALIVGSYNSGVSVFTRSGTVWTKQSELTLSGASAVALSADGNTALIGTGEDDRRAGAAWVFTRSGSTWTQQGEKLTGGGEVGEGLFGWSVALSPGGDTALIGGPSDGPRKSGGDGNGSVWVFTRSGESWTQQGDKLIGPNAHDGFGEAVALSADGGTALIGAPIPRMGGGVAWAFTHSGGVWIRRKKLTVTGKTNYDYFGAALALSGDGNTALVANSSEEGVWLFAAAPEVQELAPKRGPVTGGTSVTITGSHFTGATAVKFGSTAATSFTVNSSTSITAVSPPGSGSVSTSVATTAGTGTGSTSERFIYK